MFNSTLLDNLIMVLFVIFIIIILVLIYFVFFLPIINKNRNKLDYNTRIYVYNYETKKAYSFDKKNISNTKTFTEEEFFDEFDSSDKEKIIKFLNRCIEENKDNQFLQVRVKIAKRRKKEKANNDHFSLLEVTSINKEKKLIHLQSQLLPNISEYKRKNKKLVYNIVDNENFKIDLEKRSEHKSFVIYCLVISPDNASIITKDQDKIEQIRIQILNELTTLMDSKTFINVYQDNSIIIAKVGEYNKTNSNAFAYTIMNNALKYLKLNSYQDFYNINVGIDIFDRSKEDQDIKQTLKNAYIAAFSSKTIASDIPNIAYYQQTIKNRINNKDIYCENIINNSLFNVFYQPIFDLSDGSIAFYNVTFRMYANIEVSNFDQLLDYAIEHDKIENLVKSMMKKIRMTIPLNATCKIVLNTKLSMLHAILQKNLDLQISEYVDLVLVLKEDSIEDFEQEEVIDILKSINNRAISLALLIDNEVCSLSSEIMEEFSYFIIDADFTHSVYDDTRKQTSIRLINDSLESYRKPLLVYECSDISSIQYCLHLGMKYFLSDLLMRKDKKFMTISKENMEKLVRTYKQIERKDKYKYGKLN